MSLRARLLIGLVVLAGIGLAAAAVTTYEEQRSFLLARMDQQVASSEAPVSALIGGPRARIPRPGAPPLAVPRSNNRSGAGPAMSQPAGTYALLLASDGHVLESRSFTYGEIAASPPAVPRELPLSRFGSSRIRLFTVDSKAGSGLSYRAAAFSVASGRVLLIAVPLRETDRTLHRLIVVEGVVGSAVMLALVVLGWIVIRLGMRPVERIGRVAGEIAHGDLSRRLGPANPRTELGRLASSLNEMLVKIEQAFADRTASEDRLRQFVADASHELRTPLASIRVYAEAFRLGAVSDPATLERAMGRIEAEAVRMGILVEDLLQLASLDQLPQKRRVPVDLCELAEHAAQDTRALAPTRDVHLAADGHPIVLADADQIRQVLANLTGNVLIHTPPDSPIELRAYHARDRATLEVRDHGPGLPAGAGDRVFERFWCTKGGRRHGRDGAGLGLAIVKAIVDAHHGEVHATNAGDGGAVFRVTLPIADGIPLAGSANEDASGAECPHRAEPRPRAEELAKGILGRPAAAGPPGFAMPAGPPRRLDRELHLVDEAWRGLKRG